MVGHFRSRRDSSVSFTPKPPIKCIINNSPPPHVKLRGNEKLINFIDPTFHRSTGISTILSYPKSIIKFNNNKLDMLKKKNLMEYKFPNHHLILLLPGMGSHKNSIFLPYLADVLSSNGFFVIRLDFRGMGDSEDCLDATLKGRLLDEDVKDIDTVITYMTNYIPFEEDETNIIPYDINVLAIIGHSRGVLAMFEWASKQGNSLKVPFLFNCAGRFDGQGLYDRILERIRSEKIAEELGDDVDIDSDAQTYEYLGHYIQMRKNGEFKKTWIPRAEILSLVNCDVEKFKDLIKSDTHIISLYGSNDSIVPISAAANYANLFNINHKHSLEIILEADHNFLMDIPHEQSSQKIIYNSNQTIPFKNNKLNLAPILTEKILYYLTEEFQLNSFYNSSLSITPSVSIQSKQFAITKHLIKLPRNPLPYKFSNISNFRDIGGYPTKFDNLIVKTNCVYRSASLSGITLQAFNYLLDIIKIKCIFDLRSISEIDEAGKIEYDLDGRTLKIKNIPFNKNKSLSPEKMAEQFKSLLISPCNFPAIYMKILLESIDSIKKFFEYIIDHDVSPEQPIIYHCTAGKDRTGILTMLILAILGVDDHLIAKEYELSTIGLKTEINMIKRIEARSDLYYYMLEDGTYTDVATNTSIPGKQLIIDYDITPETICASLLSSKYETMRLFIDQFKTEFESAEMFFKIQLGFSYSEIAKIRDSLLE
ncbi:hypothetical protein TBLA_0I02850 [Henningerozyma blattae CBS 6284]|uniref:Tyrosine specific protein phosphatases domain-containing protein n=1 Tax=Henningerozyma blattae (strain ATCC 34711 / CBS 6284 / DSM 70876 / NBRC 10599 / NRRL Y-10934 / UCD 77-7) TaxID=1071380 RepID=I2H989_HENB6|nr:hypothetical protein TBLA_0I02850 [Tetrapisispora blattae CBS 6284]CCH62941.1 hypothetical protein TBLA_0I02850 [Tetrapisispora blattae CBS 6284]